MLADRLRELRKYRHMTATHLAAAAGVSKSFISQLESGRTSASLATLARIATALDVPTGALLTSAAGSPQSIADGDHHRLLHSRDQLPATPGTRLLSDVPAAVHAAVTLAPGGVARGTVEPAGGLLLTGLRGTVTVSTQSGAMAITAGEVATVERAGEYELLNDGHGPASVLVSAAAQQDLPGVAHQDRADGATAYDTSGPLRLVTMRARRTAARAR